MNTITRQNQAITDAHLPHPLAGAADSKNGRLDAGHVVGVRARRGAKAATTRSVIHVVSSLRMGGAERVVFDLSRIQARNGLDVRVLSLGRSSDALVTELQVAGVEVVCAGDHRSRLAFGRTLLRVLRGRRVQAIHIHSPFGLFVLAPFLPLLRSRVVFTRHGVSPLTRLRWRLLLPWARHFVHAVTFVSPEGYAASRWLRRGWKADQLVIENGVDSEVETERPPSSDGRVRIGSVGRLVPLKGQQFLLEAIAALPETERQRISVQIFGDGPDRERLEAIAGNTLKDIPVVFHGNVMDREEIYRQIDVLAVTSRTEGLSLAIMEAMARQIPVIATAVGGNLTLVAPGLTGMLVPYSDVPQLANALLSLVADEEFCKQLGRAARNLMVERHSLRRTAERYLEVYGLEAT